jgi:hypothetical protein
MKIGILTASHKRPKIDKCFCLMVDRLRGSYPDLFTPICVVSLEEDRKVFEEHGFETFLYPNDPLGTKHNFLYSKAKGRFTHILYLGSDDIIDNNYVDELLRNADKDIVWGRGITFYSAQQQKARYWDAPYKWVAGPAKLISSKILDEVDWIACNPICKNDLEHRTWDILLPFIKTKHSFIVQNIGGLFMDIKSEVSMNPYQDFTNNGIEADLDNIYRKLSSKEVEYLKSIN